MCFNRLFCLWVNHLFFLPLIPTLVTELPEWSVLAMKIPKHLQIWLFFNPKHGSFGLKVWSSFFLFLIEVLCQDSVFHLPELKRGTVTPPLPCRTSKSWPLQSRGPARQMSWTNLVLSLLSISFLAGGRRMKKWCDLHVLLLNALY